MNKENYTGNISAISDETIRYRKDKDFEMETVDTHKVFVMSKSAWGDDLTGDYGNEIECIKGKETYNALSEEEKEEVESIINFNW